MKFRNIFIWIKVSQNIAFLVTLALFSIIFVNQYVKNNSTVLKVEPVSTNAINITGCCNMRKESLQQNTNQLKQHACVCNTEKYSEYNVVQKQRTEPIVSVTIRSFFVRFRSLIAGAKSLISRIIQTFSPRTVNKSRLDSNLSVHSDHVPGEAYRRHMNKMREAIIEEEYQIISTNSTLIELATETHVTIDRHILFRYYISSGWTGKYYGKR